MKWFYLFLLSHAPPWSPLRETNALTYPTSLLRLLTCHTHDYQYWQWSRTCACPWGCCAEGRMRWRRGGSCPPVWLYLSQRPSCWCDCIYENTRGGVQVMSRVRVQGAWKNHLRVHAFMLRGPALFFFLFCVKPTGFLCLCGSQSRLRQVRPERAGEKRKPRGFTFNIKRTRKEKQQLQFLLFYRKPADTHLRRLIPDMCSHCACIHENRL